MPFIECRHIFPGQQMRVPRQDCDCDCHTEEPEGTLDLARQGAAMLGM